MRTPTFSSGSIFPWMSRSRRRSPSGRRQQIGDSRVVGSARKCKMRCDIGKRIEERRDSRLAAVRVCLPFKRLLPDCIFPDLSPLRWRLAA